MMIEKINEILEEKKTNLQRECNTLTDPARTVELNQKLTQIQEIEGLSAFLQTVPDAFEIFRQENEKLKKELLELQSEKESEEKKNTGRKKK